MRRRAFHGILKQMSDIFTSVMFLLIRDIFAIQQDPTLVHIEISADCMKHGGFSGSITANHSCEISIFQSKAKQMCIRDRYNAPQLIAFLPKLSYFVKPKISRASAGVATSLPYSLITRAALSMN